jgi:hypothetical protein
VKSADHGCEASRRRHPTEPVRLASTNRLRLKTTKSVASAESVCRTAARTASLHETCMHFRRAPSRCKQVRTGLLSYLSSRGTCLPHHQIALHVPLQRRRFVCWYCWQRPAVPPWTFSDDSDLGPGRYCIDANCGPRLCQRRLTLASHPSPLCGLLHTHSTPTPTLLAPPHLYHANAEALVIIRALEHPIPGRECLTTLKRTIERDAASPRTRGRYMQMPTYSICKAGFSFSSIADPWSRPGILATGCDRPRTNVHAALSGEITHLHGRTVKFACTRAVLLKTYLDLQLAGTRHYRNTFVLPPLHLTGLVTSHQVNPQ